MPVFEKHSFTKYIQENNSSVARSTQGACSQSLSRENICLIVLDPLIFPFFHCHMKTHYLLTAMFIFYTCHRSFTMVMPDKYGRGVRDLSYAFAKYIFIAMEKFTSKDSFSSPQTRPPWLKKIFQMCVSPNQIPRFIYFSCFSEQWKV